MPFVFEVPTTLETLHDMIAMHASTGADASLIIQRIHATNSVRLNHKNKEKMQNFYDVLLRRFIAVGDAVFDTGGGGSDLDRYNQLNSLTKTLYLMSQDSPECAGSVWSRRLGIFQQAVAKRLRDVEVNSLGDACEGEFSAWPSTGMLLLMRALPHIFPSTDRRHAVITPALLLLGQILAQTPVKSRCDVTKGVFCAALMIEYTKGAKRFPPEAIAFLASVLRLYADDVQSVLGDSPLPSLSNASNCPQLMDLRGDLSKLSTLTDTDTRLSLEKDEIQSEKSPAAILVFILRLFQQQINVIGVSSDVKEVELVPGGAQLNVTHENIPEYIEARLKYHVMGRYEAQLNEILVGIYEVVPEALLTIFDFQELELLMCGLPEIDMDDWMANTVYEGVYKIPGSSHMVCRWFWEIVREYDHELKARLLQFVTGTRGVPSRGFGYLTDHNGIRKFTILSVPYPFFKFPRSQ